MRKMNSTEQVKHYLLSFDDYTLTFWYNNLLIDPYGDYSEQGIRDNEECRISDLLDSLSLETIIRISRNEKTDYRDEDKMFCLTGAENPYIISFNSFEEFLRKGEGERILQFLLEDGNDLAELEGVYNDLQKRAKM